MKGDIVYGLLIREPWISKILNGEKTWEIRNQRTNIRGDIALIRSGSGLIVGTATLADCIALDKKNMLRNSYRHGINKGAVREVYKRLGDEYVFYAWVLKNVIKLAEPIPYDHPIGAIIWVHIKPRSAVLRLQS